ncbi:MAG: hypothetical protein WC899_03070 [bacterium]
MTGAGRVAAMLAIAFLASGTACGKKEPSPAGTGTATAGPTEGAKPSLASSRSPSQATSAKMRAVIVPPSPSKLLPPRISVERTDGQPVNGFQVRWKVEGEVVASGERLPPEMFRVGDRISAIATVETAEGTVSLDTPVVIAVKSLPSVTDVGLEPGIVRTGSTVRAVVRGTSPDGGPLTFRYKWFVDDVQVKGDAAELSLENVEKGAWVHVQVGSNDGVSDGGWKNSPKYRVYGPSPVVRVEGAPTVAPGGVFSWTVSVSGAGGATPPIELASGPAGMTLSGRTIRWAVPEDSLGKVTRFAVKVAEGDGVYSTQDFTVTPQR